MKIQNLSQLKKYFENGGAIKMTHHAMGDCKVIGVVRRAMKIQTNAVRLEGGSWLYYPKASMIEFVENGFNIYEEKTEYDYKNGGYKPTGEKYILMSYTFEN